MATVLSGFKSNPARSNCLTSAPKKLPCSTHHRAKIKLSSARRKSSKLGPPSMEMKSGFPTSALHSRIAHCKTEQNKRGLSTHPCRTPPVILNFFLLSSILPTTSPRHLKYIPFKIRTRWTKLPSAPRAVHNARQCARSYAFDKSKLMIHAIQGFLQGQFYPKPSWLWQGVLLVVVLAEIHAVVPVLLPTNVRVVLQVKNSQSLCVFNQWIRFPLFQFLPMNLSDLQTQVFPQMLFHCLPACNTQLLQMFGWRKNNPLPPRNAMFHTSSEQNIFQIACSRGWWGRNHFTNVLLVTCGMPMFI